MTSSTRIKSHHLSRQAIIYVRQSTAQQAINNRESLQLQYALRDRAIALGWPKSQVVVIDSDLGMTGSTTQGRVGFQDLVSRVSLNQAGAIFAFDVTRLARNCSDWYQLLDLCGLRQCLIGDGDSVYDPSQIDGRLLLGLKGQISELELHTIRARLNAGLINKAQRGELIIDLPIGYVKADESTVEKHPNAEVQSRIEMVFGKFLELKSLGKVVRYLNENELLMPRGVRGGGVNWKEPTKSAISSMLRNPIYAGAYAYGKTRFVPQISASHKRYKQRIDQDQWKVLIQDRHPAYVNWEQFMSIQKSLEDNLARYNSHNSSGMAREGAALLQGIVYCGRCGHQMTIQYRQGAQYRCNYLYQQRCRPVCLMARSEGIDRFVSDAVLDALSEIEFDLFEKSVRELNKNQETLRKAKSQELQRLRYEAERAERQYQLCDPENRLVALELERRWEISLNSLREAEHSFEVRLDAEAGALPPKLLEQWRAAGTQLRSLWSDGRMGNAHKKRIVRTLVDKIVLKQPQPGQIEVRIIWKSGQCTSKTLEVKVGSLRALNNGEVIEEKITAMARSGLADEWIAFTLTREGYRGSDRPYIGLSLVQRVRRDASIKLDSNSNARRKTEGEFTIPQLARKLRVKIDWVFEQIILRKISVEPDQTRKRFIFAADSKEIEELERLRNAENTLHTKRDAS